MESYNIQTHGVCSRCIHLTLNNGRIVSVSFEGGCNGNLKGIASLVRGMRPEEVVERLKGITCGSKATSCPDQLAQALEAIANVKEINSDSLRAEA